MRSADWASMRARSSSTSSGQHVISTQTTTDEKYDRRTVLAADGFLQHTDLRFVGRDFVLLDHNLGTTR
jgi:hypothetical protein